MIIDARTTPVYWANKAAFDSHKYRVISNQGSTRSSKTYSLSQLMVDIATNGNEYGRKEISIVSPSLPHLKKGARKDVLKILDDLLIFNENDFNRTDQIYHFPNTGSYIEFFGAEDATKVRGPGRDILYINEAILLDRDVYTQLALRTKETIFIDFNAADEFSWVYEVSDKPENKLIVSNYRNNLENLSKEQIAEIEGLKEADLNLYKVFGLGLRGTSSETIYTHYKIIDELPNRGERAYGLDFGYNVPSALIDVEFYEDATYWDELIYETKLTTGDLIDRFKEIGVDKNTDLFFDNAEPKAGEEISRAGYNAKPAVKDVREGIRKVKSMPLYITRRSTNLLKEIRSYKWQKNKNGLVLDTPVKFMDHGLDAGRYSVFSKLGSFLFEPVAL